MTNISKRVLKKKEQDKLFWQLAGLVRVGSKKQTSNFLDALFTDSEKVMFIKRLAAVLLISEKHSSYRVAKTLKMSESTIKGIRCKYNLGEYDDIVILAKKKEFDSKQFWLTLDVLLRAGMPPMGKNRWRGRTGMG